MLLSLSNFLLFIVYTFMQANLGFLKVLVAKSQAHRLQEHLRSIIEGLLRWQDEKKNHFKAKVCTFMIYKLAIYFIKLVSDIFNLFIYSVDAYHNIRLISTYGVVGTSFVISLDCLGLNWRYKTLVRSCNYFDLAECSTWKNLFQSLSNVTWVTLGLARL